MYEDIIKSWSFGLYHKSLVRFRSLSVAINETGKEEVLYSAKSTALGGDDYSCRYLVFSNIFKTILGLVNDLI